MTVFSGISHNRQKLETTHMPITGECINPMYYLYIYTTGFSNKNACYNMIEPQKHMLNDKSHSQNRHIFNDSIYVKCSQKANLYRDKTDE